MNPPHSEEVGYPFIMTHMPEFVVKRAEDELKETTENKTRCLEELKELIQDNKTISDIDFYDDFLRQFLRRSKHDVPKAFDQLQNFIAMKKKHPHYFQTMPDEDFLKISSPLWFTFLPRRCPDGCVIALIQLGNLKVGMCIDDVWRHLSMLASESLRDPMTQVCGYKIIYVFTNSSPRILLHFTPKQAWFYYNIILNSIPGRYKEFHVVHTSVVLKSMWMMFKGFLPQKIKNRVYFHSTPEKLLDFFPRPVIPEELGGDLKNYFMSEWKQSANERVGKNTLAGQPNYF